MVTASSLGSRRAGTAPGHGASGRPLIRQASAWLPLRAPTLAPLQDLEHLDAVRWVDLNGEGLGVWEATALLNPVCHGQLDSGLVKGLVDPRRPGPEEQVAAKRAALSSAFRVRHLRGEDGAGRGSLFEPVRLGIGSGWLITSWLEPRVFRGTTVATGDAFEGADQLYLAVASGWLRERSSTAGDLARLVRLGLSGFGAAAAPGG